VVMFQLYELCSHLKCNKLYTRTRSSVKYNSAKSV